METITVLEALARATSGNAATPVTFPKIECIYVNRECIDFQRAKKLASVLERGAFPRLKCINLDGGDIRAEGARAIATALERGSFCALESVDFRFNKIGHEGAIAFAAALERGQFPKLRRIELQEEDTKKTDGVAAAPQSELEQKLLHVVV